MKCPRCGSKRTRVTRTGNDVESDTTERQRVCLDCEKVFFSSEVLSLSPGVRKARESLLKKIQEIHKEIESLEIQLMEE